MQEAIEEIRELALTMALMGNESQRAMAESILAILNRNVQPAPEIHKESRD